MGGDGVVVRLPDAGNGDGPGAHPPQATGGASGGAGHVGAGTGGTTTTGSGGSAGSAGGNGGDGSAGASGAAGTGVVDDPCTACEKANCSHPAGLTSDPTSIYAQLAAAWEVCFSGAGWPASAPAAQFCGGLQGETGTTAINGPEAGTPKTALCQDLLKCVHQTNCTGGWLADDQQGCYCGADVSLQTCLSGVAPTGLCASQIAGALESTQFSNSAGFFGDLCLANGSAFFIYDWCDGNCCAEQCLGVSPASVYADPSYCNAAGTGGTSGTGGTTGTAGAGTGGVGTGGVGTGGTIGTGGTKGTGGLAGTGGTGGTGTGGSAGAKGGSSGTGGSAVLQNGQFDTNTAGWTAGFGTVVTRSTNDAAGSTQSGSLDLVLSSGDPSSSIEAAASQCLSSSAGTTDNISAQVYIPASASTLGSVGLWFYASTDCSGPLTNVFSTTATATNGWQSVMGSVVGPSGAQSMAVRLQVVKPIGQQSAEALFDNVEVSAP